MLQHRGIEYTDVVGPFPSNPSYASIYYYSSSGCNTQLTEMRTGLLNTCFQSKDGTTMKATCSAQGLTQTFYTDSSCTTQDTNTSPIFMPSNCSASNSGDIYDSYAIADCTNLADSAYAYYPSNFVVHSWYDSSVCSSSEVVTTRGYVNNYCLQATTSASLQFEFPIYNIWTSSATCTGSVQKQVEVPESCLLSDDDGYAPYGTYNNWILYSTSSSNDNNSLSDGEIAGIVIGSVAAVAIIVGLIYYFLFYKSTGPLNQQAESKV